VQHHDRLTVSVVGGAGEFKHHGHLCEAEQAAFFGGGDAGTQFVGVPAELVAESRQDPGRVCGAGEARPVSRTSS